MVQKLIDEALSDLNEAAKEKAKLAIEKAVEEKVKKEIKKRRRKLVRKVAFVGAVVVCGGFGYTKRF